LSITNNKIKPSLTRQADFKKLCVDDAEARTIPGP